MAARAFWLIVDGSVPTAFRSRQREDLLPTLHQLQRTQPTVSLLWFERGRTWESPAAARQALEVRRRTASERNRDWRPGGSHADPRAKYAISRDEKRARFKKRAIRDRQDRERGASPRDDSRDDSARPFSERRTKGPAGPRSFGRSGPKGGRPGSSRPGSKSSWRPRGPQRSKGPKGRR